MKSLFMEDAKRTETILKPNVNAKNCAFMEIVANLVRASNDNLNFPFIC